MNDELPSWHSSNWQLLIDCLQRESLPHALLFAGPPGLGKNQFAQRLSQAILCENSDNVGSVCRQCRSCQLFAAENHPDYKVVNPLEDKKIIGVDQIREISGFLSLKSQYGLYRCIQISPADQMNENAANSLLKTLEEPPYGTILILVTDKPARISATIRSRCQKILFSPPNKKDAHDWLLKKISNTENVDVLLGLTNGAPFAALELAESDLFSQRLPMLEDLEKIIAGQANPVSVASKWLKLGAKESLYCLYSWLVDMVRLKMSGATPHLSNLDLRQPLSNVSELIDINVIFMRIDEISKAINRLNSQVNQQLLLEDLLIAWQIQTPLTNSHDN